jgi:hypothetical protein
MLRDRDVLRSTGSHATPQPGTCSLSCLDSKQSAKRPGRVCAVVARSAPVHTSGALWIMFFWLHGGRTVFPCHKPMLLTKKFLGRHATSSSRSSGCNEWITQYDQRVACKGRAPEAHAECTVHV